MIFLDPKGPPAPRSICWSQKGRDPGRDPELCLGTRDPGRDPLVLWWDPGPGPGPLSFVVGPGTWAGTPCGGTRNPGWDLPKTVQPKYRGRERERRGRGREHIFRPIFRPMCCPVLRPMFCPYCSPYVWYVFALFVAHMFRPRI